MNRNIPALLTVAFLLILSVSCLSAEALTRIDSPVILPVQITYETEPVLSMTVSRDGEWVVYSSGPETTSDLWLAPTDPGRAELPRRLTSDPFAESFPCFSSDGRYVAFVGTSHDVKGDIYLLDIMDEKSRPVRLTGREARYGGPSFSADGERLYFHRIGESEFESRIVFIDLTTTQKQLKNTDRHVLQPVIHDTGLSGTFPAVSPAGDRMAYLSYQETPTGAIHVVELRSREKIYSDIGPAPRLMPAWSPDGQYLYYTEFSFDTDRDGVLSLKDKGAVVRVSPESGLKHLMTPFIYSALNPLAAGANIFFLSDRGGIVNAWFQPAGGQIAKMQTATEQLDFAENMAQRVPYSPSLTLLTYYRVLDHDDGSAATTARAAYAIGNIYRSLDMREAAVSLYDLAVTAGDEKTVSGSLARVMREAVSAETALERPTATAVEKNRLIGDRVDALEVLKKNAPPLVRGKAAIEQARLMLKATDIPYTRALEKLEEAILITDAPRAVIAEAMLEKGLIFEKTGRHRQVAPVYLEIIFAYPEVSPFSDLAVEKILGIYTAEPSGAGLHETVLFLRNLAEENVEKNPLLTKGALNRIGDIYYDARELEKARQAYGEVLERFPEMTSQTAAARLSLAEIHYREERFRRAIDLYEKELSVRPLDDRIYQLARAGYIRKSISAGEYLFRIGEIRTAAKTFRELIDYDDTIIEAHRGYIRCAQAGGNIEQIISHYEERLKQAPDDAVALYATGLALTYRNNRKDITRAEKLIREAIKRNGQSEYFHQTLGYIYEVLETAYQATNTLEKALTSYKKAYFLNNPEENPDNTANLLLNLGNASFNLDRHYQAHQFYTRRLLAAKPFDHIETEIQFYVRLGQSAFYVDQNRDAINAFQTALSLMDERLTRNHIRDLFSETFDKLYRLGMDTVITRALKQPRFERQAKALFSRMAGAGRNLFELLQHPAAPPDDAWPVFRENIQALKNEQEITSADLTSLYSEISRNREAAVQDLSAEDLAESFAVILIRLQDMIRFPDRYITLKTEVLNRLGLALQEDGNHEQAVNSFLAVYNLNEKLHLESNLAVSRRNVGYNRYLLAGTLSGTNKTGLLKEAAVDFNEAIRLVDAYGVPGKKVGKKRATFTITTDVALDDISATQGVYGFSAPQEKRLCRAFLTRIHTELDETATALRQIEKQLRQYPDIRKVSAGDMHGVSLLYHKAGLLAGAEGDMAGAHDYFNFSSRLCLKMATPVSSALNVANLAKTLADKDESPARELRISELLAFDRETTALLQANADYLDPLIVADYHNRLGVYLMPPPAVETEAAIDTIKRMLRIKAAVGHFSNGLAALEKNDRIHDRTGLLFGAVLNLNLAEAVLILGEHGQAESYYRSALAIAEYGLLPQYRWRALAGLGQYEEALTVLEEITFLEAGCGPFEIIDTFSGLVVEQVHRGEIEEAFKLAERISEIERFHRTAFLVNVLPRSQKTLLLNTYARLLIIRDLENRIQSAAGEEKKRLVEDRSREKRILAARAGDSLENMPDIIRTLAGIDSPEDFMILMGLAIHIEDISERLVRNARLTLADIRRQYDQGRSLSTSDEFKTSATERTRLMNRYHEFLDDCLWNRGPVGGAGFLALFTPEQIETADIMAFMGPDEALLRLFRTGRADTPWLAFTVSRNGLSGTLVNRQQAIDSAVGIDYIVSEEITTLPVSNRQALALNSAHLLKSMANRRPFKNNLLFWPEAPSLSETGYTIINPDQSHRGAQTLLVTDRIMPTYSVPVREGDVPIPTIAVRTSAGPGQRLLDQLAGLPGLSLALLTRQAAESDGWMLGHIFAMAGCPAVVMPVTPVQDDPFVPLFLSSYQGMSAMEALSRAGDDADIREAPSPGNWLLIGFRGMSFEEAAAYAEETFITCVQDGQRHFAEEKFDDAHVNFENAISIAREMDEFRPFLPALLAFARESAYQGGNLSQAETFAAEFVSLMEAQQPETEEHADALLRHGLILYQLEKFDRAVPLLEESLAIISRLEIDDRKSNVLTNLGIVLEDAGRYQTALEHFQSAAAILDHRREESLLADQYDNIGRIYDLRLANYPKALTFYQKALEIRQQTGDRDKIAQALVHIGRCHRMLGNFTQAADLFEQGQQLVKDDPETAETACKLIIEKANNAWFQARYQEAFILQQEALRIAGENDLAFMEILCLNTEGLIFWTLGEYDQALTSLHLALEAARAYGKREDEIATALNNIGLVLREKGELKQALQTFDQALEIDTRLQSRWAIAYDLRNKGLTLVLMGDPTAAIPLFEEALAESTAIGDKVNAAKSLLGLAEALSETGEIEKAAAAYGRAFDLSKDMILKETMWRALYGQAGISLMKGTPDSLSNAETLLYEAVDIIESMRADILIDQLKDSFIENKLSVYETLIRYLVDTGQEIQAFEVAERSRARNFIDLLGNQRLNLRDEIDQQLYDRESSLKSRLEARQRLLAGAGDAYERDVYQAEINDLSREHANLMTEIRARNPQLASLVTVDPLKADQILRLLDPGVCLLSYYLLPDEVLVWIVSPGESPETAIQLVRIPYGRSELGREIFSYRRTIQNLEPYLEQSVKLHRILVDPVLKALKSSGKEIGYLGIIPHGPAHYLSFATLTDGDTFLIEEYPLFYLPSASVFQFTRERRSKDKNIEVLAVGNPDLGNPALDLPFSEHEVHTIRWNFPGITVLTRERATESWINSNIHRFGIIHIASHGEFDPVNPLLSAIRLVEDKTDDGHLEAGEVFGLKINADLVFLSACQTGLAKITKGDDVIGLNRSFFYAGTHAVISSLWRVSDISTAILVKRFYRMYINDNKAASLRSAMLHVRENHSHPGYWGAFTLVGDFQ